MNNSSADVFAPSPCCLAFVDHDVPDSLALVHNGVADSLAFVDGRLANVFGFFGRRFGLADYSMPDMATTMPAAITSPLFRGIGVGILIALKRARRLLLGKQWHE